VAPGIASVVCKVGYNLAIIVSEAVIPAASEDPLTYRIGVDTGGTFVDVVLSTPDGRLSLTKSLADSGDLAGAVIRGLSAAAADEGLALKELLARTDRLVHGCTVATNALLTRNGASVALLTTEGFRDVLNMRRGMRDRPMDSRRAQPPPLVSRSRIIGIRERIAADGAVTTPLDEAAAAAAIATLEPGSVAGVAVCFMFSFLDASHEERVGELLAARLPGAHVSLSSEVLPHVGLYERVSTTAVNAFVSPLLSDYLGSLVDGLEAHGFAGRFLLMQSNGGVSSAEIGKRFGVRSVLSGPAAAPIAAASLAGLYGLRNAISVDMGGTSFDVCLIDDGEPRVTSDGLLAGHRIALPMVDIHTIGAGGGSIVGVDSRGLLSVGPQSAGAVPGPACYGRGGTEPTVTDANLLLGYIAPERFWGGRLAVDVQAAERAMQDRVATPLGLDVVRAAYGAYQVVNENMVDAIREVSVRRGFDPRQFVLVAAGGAGPLHIGALAEELEIPLVLIPRLASVFCALGGLLSDLRYEASASFVQPLASLDVPSANATLQRLRARLLETLEAENVAPEDSRLAVLVDLRYGGQFHEIEVLLAGDVFSPEANAELAAEFHRRHEVVNGYQDPSHAIEMINLRVVATGTTAKPRMPELAAGGPVEAATAERQREIYWDGRTITVPVYDRAAMAPDTTVTGPAIVAEETTTLIVPPGFDLLNDRFGNGLMYRQGDDVRALIDRLATRTGQE
jgi:N-methylhydantoinase A